MKKIIQYKDILGRSLNIGLLFSILLFPSCDEKEFLKEVPLDFYSPENSFVNYENFEAALYNLYADYRDNFYSGHLRQNFPELAWSGTEVTYPAHTFGVKPDFSSLLQPTNYAIVYGTLWKPAYKIIYDANVIIERADDEVSMLTDGQKQLVIAEASFFRALLYKMLANVYGGVPLILEEIKEPRRDFVRATRQEVYQQCATDLELAAQNLLSIDEVDDSRISNLAAYHLLSEIYISLGRWQDAIDAATVVIEHPSTSLMTERFGTRVDDPKFGGDVYWDLFRRGNHNRSTGNTEAIWVLQFAPFTPGGGVELGGFNHCRMFIPRIYLTDVINNNGKKVKLCPFPTEDLYGRGAGTMKPTPYFFETIWQKSGYDQDIRNSEYNIVRDFKVNNPACDYDGLWIEKDFVPIARTAYNDTMRNYFPAVAKCANPGNYPKELYLEDQTIPGALTSEASVNFGDYYVYRLAETYLLRAEAHLGNNDKINAAADINVVRARAHATPVDPAMVDIDYILDERIRELHFEELYLFTLMRLGKLVERTQKCFPYIGNSYKDYNNLWPIPYNEIEKNIEGNLEQNPGYN